MDLGRPQASPSAWRQGRLYSSWPAQAAAGAQQPSPTPLLGSSDDLVFLMDDGRQLAVGAAEMVATVLGLAESPLPMESGSRRHRHFRGQEHTGTPHTGVIAPAGSGPAAASLGRPDGRSSSWKKQNSTTPPPVSDYCCCCRGLLIDLVGTCHHS